LLRDSQFACSRVCYSSIFFLRIHAMNDAPTSISLLLARSYWIMFGPLLLFLCAAKIVTSRDGWFATADIAYLVGLILMIVARWFEFYKGDPRTSTGEPATKADLRRFVLLTFPVGLGVWVIANLVGNTLG
jgi:hypothetical protein